MISYQDAFDGKVNQDEFCQIVDLQTGISGTTSQVFWRELVTRKAKTQEFRFVGLNESQAASTVQRIVTDVEGTSYTVPFASSVTDGSSGTKTFETENVQVSRRRYSLHLWEVIVKRTGSEYWSNNTKIINGPSWM